MMTLFTLGPVEMYPDTMELGGCQVPYFRVPEFSAMMLENEQLIQKFSGAGPYDRTVFLTASGTGAMEATVMNCLTAQDKALVIVGGTFGRRFVDICQVQGIPYEALELEFGQELTEDMLAPYAGGDYSALLVNIHETSVGHLYDAQLLSRFCRDNGLLFIVDAISSFLADPIDMTALGIDALIGSSQKALALAPGASFVVLSERMLDGRIVGSKRSSVYFDFNDHLRNGERGQTPFTPAVQVLIQLNARLHALDVYGIEAEINRIQEVASDFRQRIGSLPVDVPKYNLSNATTPLLFRTPCAGIVFDRMRFEHEVVLTPSGGELGERMLRVGHLGNHTTTENAHVVEMLAKVLEEVNPENGIKV